MGKNGLLEIKEELARDEMVKKYAKVPVKKLIKMAREMEAKRIDGEA